MLQAVSAYYNSSLLFLIGFTLEIRYLNALKCAIKLPFPQYYPMNLPGNKPKTIFFRDLTI